MIYSKMNTFCKIYNSVKVISPFTLRPLHFTLYSLPFALLLLFPLRLSAQEADSTMNQSVRLARDYSPVVQQKNKIDRQPAQQEIKQSKSDASYIDWKVDAVRSAEIGIVPAGEVITTDSDEKFGYLELSAGNYWNTDLKAGVKIDDFSIDAKGFFTQSQLKLPFPVYFPMQDSLCNKKWHNRFLNGDIMGTYSTTLYNDAQFEAHLGTAGSSVKTFNYQFYGLSTDTLQMVSDKAAQQQWGRILGDASYETDNFKLKFAYEFNKLSVADSLSTTIDSLPGNWSNNSLMLSGKYGIYDHDNWQASLDLDLGGVFGKQKSYFIIHPTLHVSIMPNPLEWRRIYADLGFGRRRESIYNVMNQMPIAYMEHEYRPSVDCIDFTLGYENNEQGYLRWGAEINLAYVEDDLGVEAMPADSTGFDGLYLRLSQDDSFNFGMKAHVDYEYNKYFGAKAKFELETSSSDYINTGAANMKLSLHALSNPGKVKMDLGFDLGAMREVLYLGKMYDLGTTADLNFRLDWQCNQDFRVFAFANNILNQQYELWPGVPAQGFNIHAGFKWEF